MIIGVMNQKGGVGKTTLSIHLAAALALSGARVLVVDADPQGSALDWSETRQADPLFPVVGIPKATLHKEMAALGRDYDHVVIDGPPRVADVARSAMAASDLILIPVQPSPYDVWAAQEIVDLYNEVATLKENLKCAFVVNRKISNTAIGRDVTEALGGFEVPALASSIAQRVIFAESAGQGSTAMELEPNGQAAAEVSAVLAEIMEDFAA